MGVFLLFQYYQHGAEKLETPRVESELVGRVVFHCFVMVAQTFGDESTVTGKLTHDDLLDRRDDVFGDKGGERKSFHLFRPFHLKKEPLTKEVPNRISKSNFPTTEIFDKETLLGTPCIVVVFEL
ncbi:MAG: hypothetical protein A2493_02555 [Candidatus Magasanikbacteria bacterium RIFOXYC12_FULL_33_11]|uniref:Uncharacterized protein n=1 Tax=Candidatus Magasanikbacteria bacterium RIFOXYC12_FULL_33_11 TaxID=1798701 RepID=A0A1F6NQ85_9BACT|nr:MAG: hypothetical protein A2493_02555 [Candidatus Magasanikbacteria bacterium RIFOXYC12_FULL_33_11]